MFPDGYLTQNTVAKKRAGQEDLDSDYLFGNSLSELDPSFCTAINTARRPKAVSLEKRAEATYAEYRRQKESGSAGPRFRLPLC